MMAALLSVVMAFALAIFLAGRPDTLPGGTGAFFLGIGVGIGEVVNELTDFPHGHCLNLLGGDIRIQSQQLQI